VLVMNNGFANEHSFDQIRVLYSSVGNGSFILFILRMANDSEALT